MQGLAFISVHTYNDLKSVQKRRWISQAAVLKVVRVEFWNVSIRPCAQEDLFNVTDERVSKILNRIHHYTAVDDIS